MGKSTEFQKSTLTYSEVNRQLGHETGAGSVTSAMGYGYFTASHGLFEADQNSMQTVSPDLQFENSIAKKLEYIELIGEDPESFSPTKIDVLLRLHKRISQLASINRLVSSYVSYPEDDVRKKFVADTYLQFLRSRKDGDKTSWEDSAEQTVSFLVFYENMLFKDIEKDDWVEKIKEWRRRYIDFVCSDNAGILFAENSRDRIIKAVQTIPITIIDPISALLNKEASGESKEVLGMFFTSRRIIQIDPFTARKVNRYDTVPLDMVVKRLLFHELTHAVTGGHYVKEISTVTYYDDDGREVTENSDPKARHQDLWPEFWEEGMTEKFANVIAGALASHEELELARKIGDEIEGRQPVSIEEQTKRAKSKATQASEVLITPEALALYKISPVHYGDYRRLIDAFFAKLDWEMAGLSHEEAKVLASHAFSETPEDPTSNRRAFIQAVNQASHPGFFMKLQHAVEIYGAKFMQRILLGQDFDPHEPRALTSTVTIKYLEVLRQTTARLARAEERLKELESINAPNMIIEDRRLKISILRADVAKLKLLEEAIEAERVLIEANSYGDENDGIFSTFALTVAIYGIGSPEHKKIVARRETIKTARESMQRWIQSTLEPSE